jgi:FG-GAP-like repeat
MQKRTCLSLGIACLLVPAGGCPSTAAMTDGGGVDGGPPDAGADAGGDAGSHDAGTCTIGGIIYPHSANDQSNLAQCCSPVTNGTNWTPRLRLAGTLPLPPGASPDGLMAADLNGDGWMDILFADTVGNTIGIFINRQGAFQPFVTYPTGQEPHGIAVGDLNGDGNVDIVVVNATALTLGVFMGRGDGTFAQQVSYPMGGPAARVVMADFDGDGVLDVAAGVAKTIALFHGIGDGGLAPGVPFQVGGEPFGLVTADFRGNGGHDLAASVGNGVTVLLGHGDGGFATSKTADVSSQCIDLAASDWNADGHVDVSVGTLDDAGVELFLGKGDGTFSSAIPFNLGPAFHPTMVDMDADGTTDLVFDCSGLVCVLWQNPDGGRSDSVALTQADGGGLYSLIVADLNHDGSPDVAFLAGGFQSDLLVYLNACP